MAQFQLPLIVEQIFVFASLFCVKEEICSKLNHFLSQKGIPSALFTLDLLPLIGISLMIVFSKCLFVSLSELLCLDCLFQMESIQLHRYNLNV